MSCPIVMPRQTKNVAIDSLTPLVAEPTSAIYTNYIMLSTANGVQSHRHRPTRLTRWESLIVYANASPLFFRISVSLRRLLTSPYKSVDEKIASMSTMNRLSICATGFFVVVQPLHAYVTVQPDVRPFLPDSVLSDTTNLGSLVVPSVGIGTISWSSNKGKFSIHLTTSLSRKTGVLHRKYSHSYTQFSQSRTTIYKSL